MRAAIAILTVTIFATTADQAQAIGRLPGGPLQWLGWGYGAGYHAPIVHLARPHWRMMAQSPAGHFMPTGVYGPSHVAPHMYGPFAPQDMHYGPTEYVPDAVQPLPPSPTPLPSVPVEAQPLPMPPTPPHDGSFQPAPSAVPEVEIFQDFRPSPSRTARSR